MRFCMVTTFYPPYHFGGDALYVRALCRELVKRGHTVEVVHCIDAYLLGSRGEMPPDSVEPRVLTHPLRSAWGPLSPLLTHQTGDPALKRRALRRILSKGFDVVHFHNISLIGGPAVLTMSQAPVTLYTLHEHWLLCPTHVFWKNRSKPCDTPTCLSCSIRSGIPPQWWRYTDLVRQSLRAVDALLAPSAYTARRHREAGCEASIQVLPLFSALEVTDARPPQSPRPQFLFVGRVTLIKGIRLLVETFAGLPDYDLVVVGDGDLRKPLAAEFAEHKNIQFLGAKSQAELISRYRAATALIFPSLVPETFGLGVVEAFACRTPVLVRDAGGARELVEATGGGLVFRTGDELKRAVHRLAADPILREGLAKRARRGFLRLYTPRRHLDRYLALVQAILAVKRAA